MSLAMVSKASQMRASTVPLRSPSSIRRYCLPSRVLRISFSCTRKNELMLCSVASSVTKDFFICNFSSGAFQLDFRSKPFFIWPFLFNFFYLAGGVAGGGVVAGGVVAAAGVGSGVELSPDFLPKRPYFLWPFLDFVTSGVALTS